jgi:hypothetical protein
MLWMSYSMNFVITSCTETYIKCWSMEIHIYTYSLTVTWVSSELKLPNISMLINLFTTTWELDG